MIETWREARNKGMKYLIDCAVSAVRFQHTTSIANGAEIPLAEIVEFIASEAVNDIYPESETTHEADVLFDRVVRILNEKIGIA